LPAPALRPAVSGGVLVIRSVRTLPYAVVSGGDSKFSPTNEQWKQIERAYGHALKDNVREAIVAATINHLLFELFERAAEPVSLERKRVETVQKDAKALYDALVIAPATTATIYAHLDPRGVNSDEFLRQLASLGGACASRLAELGEDDDPNLPGHHEGDCWRDWVRALTRIAEQHKLRSGVRADTDKNWRGPSPFVVLVYELQELLPAESRRHHGCGALAKAIQRARQGKV
jgi:hypothetical protein